MVVVVVYPTNRGPREDGRRGYESSNRRKLRVMNRSSDESVSGTYRARLMSESRESTKLEAAPREKSDGKSGIEETSLKAQ